MDGTVVTLDLSFRDAEHLRSEYHSFANLINVVHAELQLLERMCGPDAGLRPTIRLCEAAARAFKDRDSAVEHGTALAGFKDRVRANLSRVRGVPPYEQDAEEARDLINEVLDDADLRIQELLRRHCVERTGIDVDPETSRALIAAGAGDSIHLSVTAKDSILSPERLLSDVGRLAAVVSPAGQPVSVSVAAGTTGAPTIELFTGPVSIDPVTGPPGAVDMTEPAAAARTLVALIYYIAGDASEVTIDLGGSPFLRVFCR